MSASLSVSAWVWCGVACAVSGCQKEEPVVNTLVVSPVRIEIPAKGGSTYFNVVTDAAAWAIQLPIPPHLELSKTGGVNPKNKIDLKVTSRTLTTRTDTLVVTAGNAEPMHLVVVQAPSEYLYTLGVDKSSWEHNHQAARFSLQIVSTAPDWEIVELPQWVTLSQTTGSEGTFGIQVDYEANQTGLDRSVMVQLKARHAPAVELRFVQWGGLFPSYNGSPAEPDATGMESTAMELAEKMKIGWNIGNTLEATGGESAWGNPLVTAELIALVKQNGFDAIRIPCSWNQYLENSASAKIKTQWLDRVKTVVQYCMDQQLYVILNIHWDQGWLENNCTLERQVENNAKQKAFWEQIATHFREFDEHLLFAGANEPNVANAIQMEVLHSYHQTFVDAVRSTGGRNSYRTLVVQGPSTDVELTHQLMTMWPRDEVAGKLMAEIHYYTPFQFCMLTEDVNWGKMFYYWGKAYHSATDVSRNATWGEEATLDDLMGKMKTQFVDRGIPVIMGEFGAIRRSALSGENLQLHLASRAYYLQYLTQSAKHHGLVPFYWDAGNTGVNSSALFDRRTLTVYDPQALNALMEGIQTVR